MSIAVIPLVQMYWNLILIHHLQSLLQREISTLIVMIPLLHIDIAYNVKVPNKNDGGPNNMMLNFDAIPILLPVP